VRTVTRGLLFGLRRERLLVRIAVEPWAASLRQGEALCSSASARRRLRVTTMLLGLFESKPPANGLVRVVAAKHADNLVRGLLLASGHSRMLARPGRGREGAELLRRRRFEARTIAALTRVPRVTLPLGVEPLVRVVASRMRAVRAGDRLSRLRRRELPRGRLRLANPHVSERGRVRLRPVEFPHDDDVLTVPAVVAWARRRRLGIDRPVKRLPDVQERGWHSATSPHQDDNGENRDDCRRNCQHPHGRCPFARGRET